MRINSKKQVNIVWLKRDLRLTDHEPLQLACASTLPFIIIYCFEPQLISDPHYDERHWRFVYQSLEGLNKHLEDYNSFVHIFTSNLSDVLKTIEQEYSINNIYSHQETGIAITYERDKALIKWCNKKQVIWHESQLGAVIRPSKNRLDWDKNWKKFIHTPICNPKFEDGDLVSLKNYAAPLISESWQNKSPNFQVGGTIEANHILNDFFDCRGKLYHKQISSPSLSRHSCSRLSPYLAWGNISLREFYQRLLKERNKPGWRRALAALSSRLHWHCHFIQKFEDESHMEFENSNLGFSDFPYREDDGVPADLKAWEEGNTGYPLVDACMRCLKTTGYINFRMRAILVSFLTHNLMIDWRLGVHYLARLFLDFEPGIHYPQFQMQAGVIGINTIRIYNVTKQAQDQDPDGTFIKKYVPELSNLPKELIHTPWQLTEMEKLMYDFRIGEDYPERIVDIKTSSKNSRELLWEWRKKPAVLIENQRILKQHVRPKR